MSRTDPFKKKRSAASKTILVFCEGAHEDIFLKYLKSLYAFNSDVAVSIKKGKGGGPGELVMQADKIPGAFDIRIVVLDNDKDSLEMQKAREIAKSKKIKLFEHTPCLEAVLLSTLNNGKSLDNKSSSWCKKEFEAKYINTKKRNDLVSYKKIFPKKILDENRRKIAELDRLVNLMEGKKDISMNMGGLANF